jgi:hypothetical protein
MFRPSKNNQNGDSKKLHGLDVTEIHKQMLCTLVLHKVQTCSILSPEV